MKREPDNYEPDEEFSVPSEGIDPLDDELWSDDETSDEFLK